MIRRLHIWNFGLHLILYALPLLAFALGWYIRFSGTFIFDSTDYEPGYYFQLLVFSTVTWALVAEHFGLADIRRAGLKRIGIGRTASACVVTYIILCCGLFFYRQQSFSRIFLALTASGLLLFSISVVCLWSRVLARFSRRDPIGFLIVGADRFAIAAARALIDIQPSCRIAAMVRLPGQTVERCGVPVYEIDDLARVAHADIREVVFAVPPSHWPEISPLLPVFERFGVPLRGVLDFGNGICVADSLIRVGSMSLFNIGKTPFDTYEYVLLKRTFDVIASSIGLLLSLPVLVTIAIAIRLTSKGPVLFDQKRVGLNGSIFRMYKFRTMQTAPSAHSDTAWREPLHRCTRIGSLLRRYSLDELPQLWNVLKGDMSLVGPRPERPHFVKQFLEDFSRYNTRHRLKVGMTGWAQVNGLRGDTSIAERLRHDLYYLQHWSLAFDLRILWMTVASEFFGWKRKPKATHPDEAPREIHFQRGHSTITRSASRM
jgi:exopolysaccharide biosynthesis polyprenyl glycosylphosphotransferase